MAPEPPTLGAPRRSRGTPRGRARSGCRYEARELSFPGGGERAYLTVRAVPAGGGRGARLGVARPDADRRRLDRVGGLRDIVVSRRMATDQVRVDEAKFDALGQRPRHVPPCERVDLQLETLGRAPVRVPRSSEVAGLVVDD